MNNSPSQGFKLTIVIFAVLIMAVGAVLSGQSVADDAVIEKNQSEE